MGKAKLSTDANDLLKKLKHEKKQQAGFNRQSFTGVAGGSTSVGGSGKSGGTTQRNDSVGFLPSTGGTITGVLALHRKSAFITANAIDVGSDNLSLSGITSYSLVTAGSSELHTISGAKHAGQILFLQANNGFTIKHGTGNISFPDAADLVVSAGDIVLLIFDDTAPDGDWRVVANYNVGGGGGGGMNTDLSNMTGPTAPTVDLNMNNNDIIGVANIDLDGVTATVEGVRNLNFYSGHNINDLTDLLYSTNGTNAHRFLVGAVAKFDITNAAVEVRQSMDMNNNTIVAINKLEFNNDANDNITSDLTGITYNVNLTDEHFFKVGGDTIMTIDHSEVLFDETIKIGTGVVGAGIQMDNTEITQVAVLRFNTSGQSLTTSASELLYQVPGGDTHAFYVASAKTLEITDTYLEMQTNRYIDFGANIALTANSGFLSLPSNPVGFIKCKVNGSDARIPYYAV